MAAGMAVFGLSPAASADETPVLGWAPTTSAGTYSYNTITVGQSASQTFTLTNSGGAATLR